MFLKKIILIVSVLAVIVSFTACSKKKDEAEKSKTDEVKVEKKIEKKIVYDPNFVPEVPESWEFQTITENRLFDKINFPKKVLGAEWSVSNYNYDAMSKSTGKIPAYIISTVDWSKLKKGNGVEELLSYNTDILKKEKDKPSKAVSFKYEDPQIVTLKNGLKVVRAVKEKHYLDENGRVSAKFFYLLVNDNFSPAKSVYMKFSIYIEPTNNAELEMAKYQEVINYILMTAELKHKK